MIWDKFKGLILLAAVTAHAHQGRAADIFEYVGPYSKAHGGAGVIMSDSGAATLHNPANIMRHSKSDYFIDLSPSKLDYQFTSNDPLLKPGNISIPVVPLMSVGGSFKAKNIPLSVGYLLAPTGIGSTTKVKDFPISVNGQYQLAALESSSGGFKTGIGIASPITSHFNLGLSLIYDYTDNLTRVSLQGSEFLSLLTRGRSVRTVFGARYQWTGIGSLALSYQPEKKHHYSLRAKALGSDAVRIYQNEYKPTIYGLGFHSRRIGKLEPFAQYSHERWVAATFDARSPTQAVNGAIPVEYLNTHNIILGTRYSLHANKNLIASYSQFQKNKGDGLSNPDGTVAMQGRGPQDFEALDRYHLTMAYENIRKSSNLLLYGTFIRASAASAEQAPSAGYYELTILMLGLSYVGKITG